MHYGNILEYLSLWCEVQFLNVQIPKISKKSGNLTKLDFTPETCQKIEKNVDFKLQIQGKSVKNSPVSYTAYKL